MPSSGTPTMAPPMPRFHDASTARPSTAPNGTAPQFNAVGAPSRLGRESFKGPPVAPNHSRTESVSGPQQIPHVRVEPEPERAPVYPSAYEPPPAPFASNAHNRHTSVQSISSNRFVDILDAQSEFKPSNFRTRVQATGARDYGEDVADRNIGVNGVNLNSSQVQAFYALTSGSTSPNQSAPAPSVARMAEGPPQSPTTRIDSGNLGNRTRSVNSATFNSFPRRSSSFQPRESGAVPPPKKLQQPMATSSFQEHRGRRQSVNSYVPTAATDVPSLPSRSKRRPASLQRNSIGCLGPSPAIRQQSRPNTSYDKSGNDLGIYTPTLPNVPPVPVPLSPRMPRDSVLIAKKKNSAASPTQQEISDHVRSAEGQRSARPQSRRESVTSSAFSSPNSKVAVKRHSMSSVTGGREMSRQAPVPRSDWPRSSQGEGGGSHDGRGIVGRVDVESSVDANLVSPAPSPC
jgi:hypothetical protein